MKKTVLIFLMLLVAQIAATANAAPLKVFVAGVTAVGTVNRDEVQLTIKTLLTTRLNRDTIATVENAAEADCVVTLSYVVAGQTFSLDAVATSGGKTKSTVFVEGEHPGGLISGVGKLADKLAAELPKVQPVQAVSPAVPGDIVRINDATMGTRSGWRSQPLSGAFNLIAAGSRNPDGSREVFLADNRRLLHYRQGKDFRLVSEKELKVYEKIVSLDVIEAGSGSLELYLTVLRNDQPASQIWQLNGDTLQLIAADLPYYFRALSLPGSTRKIYAQKSGGEQFFTNEIFEAARQGAGINLLNPITLPRPATIYTFARFAGKDGRQYTATYTSENKLVVFDSDLREMWRSSETYGGSELFLEKPSLAGGGGQGETQTYMNQRILVTPGGEVLVGKNDSHWLLGKKSNYSNGTVFCLSWSGDHLEGKWHTRVAEYYMPDFFYDDMQKELLQLELVSRPHIFSKGSTVLTVRKVD